MSRVIDEQFRALAQSERNVLERLSALAPQLAVLAHQLRTLRLALRWIRREQRRLVDEDAR